MSQHFLSIIFPAHNEEYRLTSALQKTINLFKPTNHIHQKLSLVENGSSDHTLDIAQSFQARFPNVIVIHEEGRGKGLAVQRGMLAASGDYRITCDVDLSMPIEEVNRFIPPEFTGRYCHSFS